MTRQHATPLLLSGEMAAPLRPLGQTGGEGAVTEAEIQALIHNYPNALPIAEIDPLFVGAVAICTELNTAAGTIDNLLVTPSGLPVLVECKLWRNPEGRREVVGQILDYAKELSRWSSSDLQREVSRLLKQGGNSLLDLVKAADPNLDEIAFNDALTNNLRRGRFLLLIVGDGIREGVEAIAEYLQIHAGLHFSLGLVELPIYLLPDDTKLVVPRVLARTTLITRTVVAAPDGYTVDLTEAEISTQHDATHDAAQRYQAVWTEFLTYIHLDDPEQAVPKPARQGSLFFMLPAPGGSSWITVYRDARLGDVGLFLSYSRNSAGEYAMQALADEWDVIGPALSGSARLSEKDGRKRISDAMTVGALDDDLSRHLAFEWLASRVNTFVNVLRPRVRSAASDYETLRS